MVQNFHLLWLDPSIDEVNNDDCRNVIAKFCQIVTTVNTFIDVDECIDFITEFNEEKAFVVISDQFSGDIISMIQDISQVDSIFLLCRQHIGDDKRANKWPKVGVYTDIITICEALKQASSDYEQNSVSIGFVKKTDGTVGQSLDTLDCSFMYTQILKDILLTIDFEQGHINDFLTYCRQQLAGNDTQLNNVEKLRREYRDRQPIWWYTYQSFLYSMLNRALRLMDVDLLVKMGFFVRDLHNHIASLYSEQYSGRHHTTSFIVYRGQGSSQTDFDQLKATQGELLAFNNFLSTSYNHDVSLKFAQRIINTSSLVGVLFIMKIDPSVSATPFANVKDVSCYAREEEILFSMHSIFRIGQVRQIDHTDRLWQVKLTLTGDNDPQLHHLTKTMQDEMKGSTGWHRLGHLLMQIGQSDKAEELYEMLLQQTTKESARAPLYHQLGGIKVQQGKYAETVGFYERSIVISEKILSPTDSVLATSYGNIGHAHYNMGEYSKALSFYENALEIEQKTLPANHPHLATSYEDIGRAHHNMGEHSKTLSFYEKALEIRQKILPANHPDFATSYENIATAYHNMGEYSKTLSFYEKALEIQQKILPANHPNLATSYGYIGHAHYNMGEYSKALSFYENALGIEQITLPANHPDLATSYSNIGSVCYKMGEYSTALSFLERALNIFQRSLPSNHPNTKTVEENIAITKKKL